MGELTSDEKTRLLNDVAQMNKTLVNIDTLLKDDQIGLIQRFLKVEKDVGVISEYVTKQKAYHFALGSIGGAVVSSAIFAAKYIISALIKH